MNQEQKFDKIIKKKVDEAEFPFDEQNWNKLSVQLDAERRVAATGRGWGKFLYLGLLFLGITSVGIALYKIQGPFGFKEELTANSSNSKSNSNSFGSSNGAYSSAGNSKHELLALNNAGDTKTETNLGENKTTLNSEINNNSETVIKNEIINKNSNADVQNTVAASLKNSNGALESSVNATSANSSIAKNSRVTSSNHSYSLQKNSSLKNDGADEIVFGNRTKTDLAGEVVLEHTVLDRINATLPIIASTRNVKTGPLKMPSWYDDDYHRKGKKRLSFLNAEVGGAFLLGWDSKNGKDSRGLNWYAGVNYGKFYTKKIGFSVGSQFYNVGNIKQPFYESSKAVYGLGSTSSNTVITTQALFYFSVPVKFYYALSPNHQVGASVNASFLFSSKNAVENYHLTDNVKSNEMKSTTSGIYEGVRLNNILVSAFYRAKLNKRLYLNTEVLYGIRDIFKNTATNNYTQKPVGLRVGLQYTLFEK